MASLIRRLTFLFVFVLPLLGMSQLVINEVNYNNGTDFIEIRNNSNSNVDLSFWQIIRFDENGQAQGDTIQLNNVILGPLDYYVVGGNGSGFDQETTDGLTNLLNDNPNPGNGIGLYRNLALFDGVAYEGNVPGVGEGAFVPQPGAGNSIQRIPNGIDSNNNSTDFTDDNPTPGVGVPFNRCATPIDLAAVLSDDQNFDAFNLCGNGGGCVQNNSCIGAFNGGWTNEFEGDELDWGVNEGPVPTPGAGPNADHTTGSGKYVYMDLSRPFGFVGQCLNQTASFSSPCYIIPNNANQCPTVSFWYYIDSERGNVDVSLTVSYINNATGEVTNISTITPGGSSNWRQINVELPDDLKGTTGYFRWTGIGNGSNASDISIDDVLITLEDLVAPTFNCPNDLTVSTTPGSDCKAIIDSTIKFSDISENCGIQSIQINFEDPNGNVNAQNYFNPANGFVVGTTKVEYIVTDFEGNVSAPCNYNVTVIDNTAPIINNCVPNSVVTLDVGPNCQVDNYQWANGPITAEDECSNTVNIAFTTNTSATANTNGGDFPLGNNLVTVTATDDEGNERICEFSVQVQDNTGPVLSCPLPIQRNTNFTSCDRTVGWTEPQPSDFCGIASVESDVENNSVFPLGITTVTYTATDNNGNISTCSFDVEVVDNVKPVVADCPQSIEIFSDENGCNGTYNFEKPTANDNCTPTLDLLISESHQPGEFSPGTTFVEYAFTDESGNVGECKFEVKVVDNKQPIINCPSDISVFIDNSCDANFTFLPAEASDNCGIQSITYSIPSLGINLNPTGSTISDATPNGTRVLTAVATATDINNKTAQCEFRITIRDTIAPVIQGGCPPLDATVLPARVKDNCFFDQLASNFAPVGTDPGEFHAEDCGVKLLPQFSRPLTSEFPVGKTPLTALFVDNSGNTSKCDYIIEVIDEGIPEILNCPSPDGITALTDPSKCGANVPFNLEFVDNCGISEVIGNFKSGDFFQVGTTTVDISVRDSSGNEANCNFQIEVRDEEVPVIIRDCPSDLAVASSPGECGANVSWIEPVFDDNCDFTVTRSVNGITNSFIPGDFFPVGTYNVSYVATDNNNVNGGNANSCDFQIAVIDNEDPVIVSCPNDIIVDTEPGKCSARVDWSDPVYTDNCGIADLISNFSKNASFPVGSTRVFYTAKDVNGNFNTSADTLTGANGQDSLVFNGQTNNCTFFVRVNDIEGPKVVNCPSDITVVLDPNVDDCGTTVNYVEPYATDNCASNDIGSPDRIAPSFASHRPNSSFFNVGRTQVEYIFQDSSGLEATCMFSIDVLDVTAPEIDQNLTTAACNNFISNAPFVVDESTCDVQVTWDELFFQDDCGIVSQETNLKNGAKFGVGSYTVIVTATDPSGNTKECKDVFIVTDEVDPFFNNCPSDITILLEEDDCSVPVSWTKPQAFDNCDIKSVVQSHQPGDVFNVGTTEVTYFVFDQADNRGRCDFKVNIVDQVNPEIIGCPSDIQVNNQLDRCGARVNWADVAIQASDNCVISAFNSNFRSGDFFEVGTTTVEYVAVDGSGNEAICSFDVTVKDNQKPRYANCPSDIIVPNDLDQCQATVTWNEPTITDNCGIAVASSNFNSGDQFPIGNTTVTYTIQDDNGNMSDAPNCTFVVTVNDVQAPTINCNALQSIPPVEADPDRCSAEVTFPLPLFDDNCNAALLPVTRNDGLTANAPYPVGTTRVTYTVRDDSGLETKCNFNITVTDNSNPTFVTCVPNQVIDLDEGACNKQVFWNDPNVTDPCGLAATPITYSPQNGSVFEVGTSTVLVTATDASGNTNTCQFTVTVQDNIAPTFVNCPSDIEVEAAANCEAVVTWQEPTVVENCEFNVQSLRSPGDVFQIGTTLVTYLVTDDAGNQDICQFNVTVTDDNKPRIENCPGFNGGSNTIFFDNDPGQCGAEVNYTEPEFFDNCSPVALGSTSNINPGDFLEVGIHEVFYSAADPSGNVTSCSFTIQVRDVEDPILSDDLQCGRPLTVNTGVGLCGAEVNFVEPIFDDNCSFTVSNNVSSGDTLPVGNTVVTYTARDETGNTTSCTFQVTVQDVEAPQFVCPSDQQISTDPGSCFAVATWDIPEVTENCGILSFTSDVQPNTLFLPGATRVTYTGRDVNGNQASCDFDVVVIDQEAPTILNCPTDVVACNPLATWTPPTATDNCNATISGSHFPGAVFPVGSTRVVYTASDQSGNISTCSFNVVVADPDFTISAGPNKAICAGDSTSIGSIELLGYNYTWSPNIALANNKEAVTNTSPSITVDYILSVQDGAGCFPSKTDTVTVTVNPLPFINIDDTLVVCQGNEIGIGGNPTATGSDLIYTWAPVTALNNPTVSNPISGALTDITYTLTVRDNLNCISTDSVHVDVEPKPNVSITTVKEEYCVDNSAVVLSAIPVGGRWSGSGIVDEFAGIWDPAVAGSGTHTITYEFTSPNGCTETVSTNFTVNQLPSVTISPIADKCASDDPFNLIGSPVGGIWTGSTGIIDQINGVFDPAATIPGTQLVQYTFTASTGCSNSATVQFDINKGPVTPVISGVNPSYCGDAQIDTFFASPAGGVWIGPGIIDPNLGIFNPNLVTGQTVTIRYEISNASGCSSIASTTISVDELPTIDFPTLGTLCSDGSPVELNPTPNPDFSYEWTSEAILDKFGPNGLFNPSIAPFASNVVSVKITDNISGCVTVEQTIVNVLDQQNVNITEPTDLFVCSGSDNVNFVGLPSGGTWSTSGAGIIDPVTGEFDVANSGSGEFTITYTITSGGGTCSGSTSVEFEVGDDFTVEGFTTNESCAGKEDGSIFLSVNGDAIQPFTYFVKPGVGNSSNPNIQNIAAGTYTIGVVDNKGCADSSTITVGLNPPIEVIDTIIQFAEIGKANGSINITVQGGDGSKSYAWSNGATTQDVSNLVGGTYSVRITDQSQCFENFSFIVPAFPVSVNEIDGVTFSLYPNPASNVVMIELQGSINGTTEFSLIDVLGGEMKSNWTEENITNYRKSINVSDYSSGQYLLRISSDQGSIMKKILIQR